MSAGVWMPVQHVGEFMTINQDHALITIKNFERDDNKNVAWNLDRSTVLNRVRQLVFPAQAGHETEGYTKNLDGNLDVASPVGIFISAFL
jgi:predicted chitinase